jgi:hypothetical protein
VADKDRTNSRKPPSSAAGKEVEAAASTEGPLGPPGPACGGDDVEGREALVEGREAPVASTTPSWPACTAAAAAAEGGGGGGDGGACGRGMRASLLKVSVKSLPVLYITLSRRSMRAVSLGCGERLMPSLDRMRDR